MSGRRWLLAAALAAIIALAVAAALLPAVAGAGGLALPGAALAAARWTAIAGLVVYAAMRRSLTTWMLVCMVAGAELGYDAPRFAISLGGLGQIFLRLIQTVLGALLFATLGVGLARHADPPTVGRVGVQAL